MYLAEIGAYVQHIVIHPNAATRLPSPSSSGADSMLVANGRDLTDAQWEILDNLIPKPTSRTDARGRP